MSELKQDPLQYAKALAIALWEKHWKETSPHWEPMQTLPGLLSQIDNMTCTLVRRRTQPEATKSAQDLSASILDMIGENPNDPGSFAAKDWDDGFEACRKAAAALASPADAMVAVDRVYAEQINFSVYDDPRFKKLTDALYMTGFHQAGSGDREVKALADYVDARNCQSIKDAERWRFRQKFLLDGGAVLWSQRGCQYRNAQGAIICQGGTEEEAIDAAIQAQKDGHG